MRSSRTNRFRIFTLGVMAGTALTLTATNTLAQSAPATAPATTAPAGDLPAAKSLIADAIGAMGGKKAFDAIKSSHSKVSMTSPMGNATVETWEMGDSFKVAINQMGMTIEAGGDGENAWMKNPMSGQWELDPMGQASELRRQGLLFMTVVNMEEDFEDLTTVGKEMFGDVMCYAVQANDEESTNTFYFDASKKFLVGVKSAADQGPHGPDGSHHHDAGTQEVRRHQRRHRHGHERHGHGDEDDRR